ncbi:MAG: MipA/OmpV family protein [Halioglobus sp.]
MQFARTSGVLACLFSLNSYGADIASAVRPGGDELRDDGGYFELGVSLSYAQIARDHKERDDLEDFSVGISLAGEYRYKGFFVEAAQGSFDGLNLGYTLFETPKWSVDLLAASALGTAESEDNNVNVSGFSEAQRNEALLERNTFYIGAGLRGTLYLDNYILQARIVSDVYDDNGATATLRLGRSWQYRNWNFHAVASTEYGSDTTMQYLYGITAEEATTQFSAYKPDAALSFTGEVGVTYPMSEDWVFRSALRYSAFPDEITDSPLVDRDSDVFFFNSINYVF